MRRRTAATLVAGLALAAVGATAPMAATAATTDDVLVTIDATAEKVIQVEDELFGRVTVVPGSHHERVLTVKNVGPSATLTVAIVNATSTGHSGDAADDPFHGTLLVNGIPASTHHDDTETVIEKGVHLGSEASTDIVLDVQLPREDTDANAADIGEREFAFDVRLTVAGDPEPTPTPTPTTTPSPAATTKAGSGPVTHTGGTLAGTNPWLLAGAAALAAIAAAATRPLVAAKRRNDAQTTS